MTITTCRTRSTANGNHAGITVASAKKYFVSVSVRVTGTGAMNLSSEMRSDPMAVEPREDDVRWEKVRALREALAAGTYRVSAEALAERLMEKMREE